ncbi:MAG TPA: dTMP kinase [Bacteroides sp.]|nr:dTMP kinase [Bacteroides sp.]
MRFIVIEGLDGSGKSTQLKLLQKHLNEASVPFRYLHFPRLEVGIYGKLVARFLRGEMGAIDRVDPYLVALIYAGDRADAAEQIRGWMDEGYLVIADRYVYSNIAFQCAKVDGRAEREGLRDWILNLEYGHHAIPRPDINLFLNVPQSFTTMQLFGDREGDDRAYLKGERDIHEENLEFQEKVRQNYLSLRDYVDDLLLIQCGDAAGSMMEPQAISEIILEKLALKK